MLNVTAKTSQFSSHCLGGIRSHVLCILQLGPESQRIGKAGGYGNHLFLQEVAFLRHITTLFERQISGPPVCNSYIYTVGAHTHPAPRPLPHTRAHVRRAKARFNLPKSAEKHRSEMFSCWPTEWKSRFVGYATDQKSGHIMVQQFSF